jgi:hypothetical protein
VAAFHVFDTVLIVPSLSLFLVWVQICHEGFADLCDNGVINVTTNAAGVLRVIGETLSFASEGEDIATDETISRMTDVLIRMQKQLPTAALNHAFASISPEAQCGINMVLN